MGRWNFHFFSSLRCGWKNFFVLWVVAYYFEGWKEKKSGNFIFVLLVLRNEESGTEKLDVEKLNQKYLSREIKGRESLDFWRGEFGLIWGSLIIYSSGLRLVTRLKFSDVLMVFLVPKRYFFENLLHLMRYNLLHTPHPFHT